MTCHNEPPINILPIIISLFLIWKGDCFLYRATRSISSKSNLWGVYISPKQERNNKEDDGKA